MGVKFVDYVKWSAILTPILFTMNNNQKSFYVGMFTAFSIGAIICALKNHVKNFRVDLKSFELTLIIMFLSFVMTGLNPVSVGAVLLFLIFFLSSSVIAFHVEKDFDIYPFLAVGVSIAMISVALERFGWSFFNPGQEPGGLMGNVPQLCLLLSIFIPFVYKKNFYIAVLLAVSSLVMHEMTGAIAFFVTALLNEREYRDRSLIGLAAVIGAIFFSPAIIQAFSIRLPVWSATLMQIASQPLTGYGPGVFDSVSGQFITGYHHAENCFSSILQAVFNCGVFILVGLAFILKSIWEGKECPERTALLVLAILALIEYPFEVVRLWPLYAIIVGVFMAKNFKEEAHVC
jgi:hypothetical protein